MKETFPGSPAPQPTRLPNSSSSQERVGDDQERISLGLQALLGRASERGRMQFLTLVRADQLRRWQGGERVLVENYVRWLPRLGEDAEALLDLIFSEVLLREEQGEHPTADEYVQRFPQHEGQIQLQFEMHEQLLDSAKLAQKDTNQPAGALTGEEPRSPDVSPFSTRYDLDVLAGAPLTRLPTTPPLLAGPEPERPVIPGYEIFGELGRGGMGIVYQARQLGLNRIVALKMILSGHADRDDIKRFRAEAEAVARFQHPNIVQIYEVGEYHGRPFFSLEYVDGGSLDKRLAGTPLPATEAAELLVTLARAIHAAHQRGIIHRDLKPANVLVTSDGVVKVTDFGLAKQLDDQTWRTHSGVIMGTPNYMSPEQAFGHSKQVGAAADVWALGAVLYELLTGRPPFLGATLFDTLQQVCSQDPVPPSRLQTKMQRDLETICLKCLQKEQPRRYASALALADDLERFLNRKPILARPVSAWERGVKWVKRSPTTATLLAVSLLAVVGIVAGGLLYQEQRARVAEQDATLSEQKLIKARQLETEKDEARPLILEGQGALARKEFDGARLSLEKALARMRPDEPSLRELRAQARRLLAEANQGLAEIDALRKGAATYVKFLEFKKRAVFSATLATGAGLKANLQETRKAARDAFTLCGLSLEARTPLRLTGSFTKEQREDLVAGCYELLLTLADIETQEPKPSNKREPFELALRLLDRAATLGYPSHRAYHLRRARYLEQLDRRDEAERQRALARQHPPNTALDYFLIGDEHYKEGRLKEAARAFESALAVQPDHFWARYFLGVAYLRLERAAEARVILGDCLQQDRNFIWVYLLRGFAHVQLREYAAAAADFDTARALNPGPDARHVLYANRGVMWFQQGELARAAADLLTAIELKPKEYQAHVTLAQVYQKQTKWAEAIAQLGEAIDLEPELAFLYRLRARLQLDRKDRNLAAALADADKVIELEERAGRSLRLAKDHAQRGQILFLDQKYEAALAGYEKALAIDTGCTEAYLWRAEAEFRSKKYKEAVASLNLYLAKGGLSSAEVYRARGQAWSFLGKYPAAVDDFGRAIQLKPGDAVNHEARGWASLACEAYPLAEADFTEAIRLDPKKGDPFNGRGYARVKLGKDRAQWEKGIEDAETAVRLGPQTPRLFQDSARVYAQALARMDEQRLDGTALKRRAHEERALDLLRKALAKASPKEQEDILKDPTLSPLLSIPEFRGLLIPLLPPKVN